MIERGYMYILECSDGSYYTGSTIDLKKRLEQHQNGEGANHTKKHLPVTLVYHEVYYRIDEAFYREKQVQKWNKKKKEALVKGEFNSLPALSMAYRDVASRASATGTSRASATSTSRASATDVTDGSDSMPEVLEGRDDKELKNNRKNEI